MHPDPRSGCGERSSQLCSDELLSVQGVDTLHLMLHAREERTGKPRLPARPFLWDGHFHEVTRGDCGRVDLRSS
jgi:hypothetical protein